MSKKLLKKTSKSSPSSFSPQKVAAKIFKNLDLKKENHGVFDGKWHGSGSRLASLTPIDGSVLAYVKQANVSESKRAVLNAEKAFLEWKKVPAPKRGDLIRQLGNALREHKEDLGTLVTLETGKILQEGLGEVQEMIDICDFAVGLSRQLNGQTIPSERPSHLMMEQWHPLGVVGIITAFNFPAAVWAWNSSLAAVCGNSMVWKPSEKTPLTAIACTKIIETICKKNKVNPAVFSLVVGDLKISQHLVKDPHLSLISATGSTKMGKSIAQEASHRLEKTILELGGNNAVIVSQHADQDMALQSILFGSVGTAGQRCTSTRRLILHESIHDEFVKKLSEFYKKVPIGNPLDPKTLMGPLASEVQVTQMMNAIKQVEKEGGKLVCGGEKLGGGYVTPAIALAKNHFKIVQTETFAPLLYVMSYKTIDQAIKLNNEVPQGLSSALFSNDVKEIHLFTSGVGSDCGIANVNIGTSGAEIGGAFGGEKETGGGRESGSDAWKAYMRRQTNTINFSKELPLAQGVKFNLKKK
jgi:aldehyde dehydrogenase (NAD+)